MSNHRFLVALLVVAAACSGGDDVAPDAGTGAFMPTGVTTLVSGVTRPDGLVADEDAVYYVTHAEQGSAIHKLDLHTLADTVLAPHVGEALRVYADADTLYCASAEPQSRIIAVSKADGSSRDLVTNAGLLVSALAVHQDALYWIGVESATNETFVYTVKKDGTGRSAIGILAGRTYYDVAADDRFVYGFGESIIAFDRGFIQVKTLASVNGPGTLGQDTTSVYWSDSSDGTIKRVAKSGGTPTTIASNLAAPARFAVAPDGTVYAANRGAVSSDSTTFGSVVKIAPGSTTPVAIASGLDHPIEPAVLQHAVVWTVSGGMSGSAWTAGSIMAAPR